MNPWQIDEVQFSRLLAEADAAGLFDRRSDEFQAMCDSMDLTSDEVSELLARAQMAWDQSIAATGDTATRKKLDALHIEATVLHVTDDIEIDAPLYPCHISEGDDGTWVRAWVLVPNSEDDECSK